MSAYKCCVILLPLNRISLVICAGYYKSPCVVLYVGTVCIQLECSWCADTQKKKKSSTLVNCRQRRLRRRRRRHHHPTYILEQHCIRRAKSNEIFIVRKYVIYKSHLYLAVYNAMSGGVVVVQVRGHAVGVVKYLFARMKGNANSHILYILVLLCVCVLYFWTHYYMRYWWNMVGESMYLSIFVLAQLFPNISEVQIKSKDAKSEPQTYQLLPKFRFR